jgi:hypothetical protein
MIVLPLRLTVPFHADETPTSYASRLAACNGTRLNPFCNDIRIRPLDIADGDEDSLRTLAALGGIEPEFLLANAFVKSGPLEWTFRAQSLDRIALRRTRLAICPACALADIKARPKLMPESATYGRAAWLLDVVRLCPVHRIPLAYAEEAPRVRLLHDFAQHVKLLLPRLPKLAEATPQDPGPLQAYALRRLDGAKGAAFLDPMHIASLVRLCETAGAVALFPDLDTKQLTDEQREAAGTVGYNALKGGAATFRPMLAQLKSAVDRRSRLDGPTAAFGKLYWLLSRTLDDPDLDPVRDIMRDFVLANFAIESGQSVLGKALDRRRLHSIQTLARQTSVHPKVLRRHLRTAGLLAQDQIDMSDHNVLFDADAGLAVATPLADALSAAEAMEHLNAPRSQMALFVEHGFLQPGHRAADSGGQDRYAAADLDAFLLKLGINSPSAYHHRAFRNIPETAKQCCRSAADIIRLIVDGRLETKKATGSVRGYLSILVDPAQVAKALHGPETDGVPLRDAARRVGTSDRVLDALIEHGHIAKFVAANPVNKCPQNLVAVKELERFRSRYVSLWTLAKEQKLHMASMKILLEAAGLEPAIDPDEVGARFYWKADLLGNSIGNRLLQRKPRKPPSSADKRPGGGAQRSRRRKDG